MIYLAHTNAEVHAIEDLAGVVEIQPLADGLVLIESDLSRSRLYHGLKELQDREEALLVVVVTVAPKFKGMEPGALAWVRGRLPTE